MAKGAERISPSGFVGFALVIEAPRPNFNLLAAPATTIPTPKDSATPRLYYGRVHGAGPCMSVSASASDFLTNSYNPHQQNSTAWRTTTTAAPAAAAAPPRPHDACIDGHDLCLRRRRRMQICSMGARAAALAWLGTDSERGDCNGRARQERITTTTTRRRRWETWNGCWGPREVPLSVRK